MATFTEMIGSLVCLWAQFVLSDVHVLSPERIACDSRRVYRSHNNVDITFFQGKYYLAFRTAPTHFPSRKAQIRIMHSSDLQEWTCDTSFCMGRDLREPRWLVWKGRLYLYFFAGSQSSWRFDSKGIIGATQEGNGRWDTFQIGWAGWVPWRARAGDSVAYLSVYWGRDLYGLRHHSEVRLLCSTDGRSWHSLTPAPQLSLPHATETDFWIESDGKLWAITRSEGRGSYLSYASSPDSPWTSIALENKYDSPLLFGTPDGLYLIARRHLPGKADRAPRVLPAFIRRYWNLLLYSLSRKRTALYRIDTLHHRVEWLMDIPGWGDTAFPAIYPSRGEEFIIANYTNPLSGKDVWWLRGQLSRTVIYTARLRWVSGKGN
ncbi:MAG: hypothetical protein NZZ60_06410 [Bacteroidia bacterium]|nr:hypothetical protein [Bacteroidia bacterium]MCX7651836.1 hypothetical protein [Bacteroidia bacterium]